MIFIYNSRRSYIEGESKPTVTIEMIDQMLPFDPQTTENLVFYRLH